MNVKFEIFKETFKVKIGELIRKGVYFLLTPLAWVLETHRTTKLEKRREYNLAMTEEALMKRFAKYLIKDMIRGGERYTEFVYCEASGISIDRNNYNYIIHELKNLHSTKDKYLTHYWKDVHSSSMKENETVEMEKRLNLILKNELEKMGIETYYKVSDSWTDSWKSRTKYVHSLYIKLS